VSAAFTVAIQSLVSCSKSFCMVLGQAILTHFSSPSIKAQRRARVAFGEVVATPPSSSRGACIVLRELALMLRQLASNEHLDYVAALLDDIFRIPGTKIRFGLDALIGWVPGIGDAMTGIASFLIVFASWRRGAKAVTLVRMIANVLLETAIGAIPVAGDVFHVVWKANRRNYRLLIREREEPGANTRQDWIFLAVLLFAVIAAAGIPIAILIWLLRLNITLPFAG